MSEKKPKVHSLSGRSGPRPEQIATACDTCKGKGWIGGAMACPECNTPPACRCVNPRPNSDDTFCVGCGQAAPEVEVDAGELAGETTPTIPEEPPPIQPCAWTFGDNRCGWTPENSRGKAFSGCDKTFEDCVARGRELSFGGFPLQQEASTMQPWPKNDDDDRQPTEPSGGEEEEQEEAES